MAGDGGEGVDGASVAGCGCGGTFATVAAGIHHAGITDRSENRGKRKVERKDASANIGFGNGDGPARTEEDVVKDATIFAESDFAVGAAIEIIENNAREAALRHFAKIVDIDDAGWRIRWHRFAQRFFSEMARVSTQLRCAKRRRLWLAGYLGFQDSCRSRR